jgi:hypothetical protein
MAQLVQDPRLRMTALGIVGDPEIQNGVHLRWTMAPELGFPPGGFRLFIRPSQAADPQVVMFGAVLNTVAQSPTWALVTGGVTLHDAGGVPLAVGSLCQQRGLVLSERPLVLCFRPALGEQPSVVREVTLYGVKRDGAAFARGLYSGQAADSAGVGSCLKKLLPGELVRPVLQPRTRELLLAGRYLREETVRRELPLATLDQQQRRRAAALVGPIRPGLPGCDLFTVTLRADAIDTVLVNGCGGALLLGVAYVELRKDECERGWQPLVGPICLPIGEPSSYPCSEDGGSGRDRAKARLPTDADQPPEAPSLAELADRLLGTSFDELQKALVQMWELAATEPPHLQLQRLASEEPGDLTTYRLQTIREVLLGCVEPYFARIIGLYHVDRRTSGAWDYKVEAAWPQRDGRLQLCWVVFGVAPAAQPSLAAPLGVTATAIPGASRVAADGTVDRFQMDVGVRWRRPTRCDLTDPLHAAAVYFVERTGAGAPVFGPYRLVNQRVFEEGGKPEPTPLLLVESHAGETPVPLAEQEFPLGYFIDRGPGYGRFYYRVRARDLFGRTSPPSAPAAVLVRDQVPPGSPLNLEAVYFDPADPAISGSEALAWANQDMPPGAPQRPAVLVRWVWPVARQQQAPDASEFRLYYRSGLLNAVSGSVTEVTPLGGKRFRVDTDLPPVGPDFPVAPAPIDLGSLRNEGEDYPIETVQAVFGELSFEVLANPKAPPMPGQCTFRLGAGTPARGTTPARPAHPACRSYRDPADWEGLVLDPQPPGTLVPLRIGIDGSVLGPLPPGLTAADVDVSRTFEPAAGGAHWHDEMRLRGIVLYPSRQRPRAVGSFGITAVDDASPPNESRVSPPAGIFAVHRQPPEVPELTYPDEICATPADFHGHSYFTLEWPAEAGVGYLVYRSSDVQLLAAAGVSLVPHRALSAPEQRQQLQQLGSRQANLEAFSAVTPEPVWAAATGPLHYRDRLDGTLRNRFIYRIRSLDRAGNLADWPVDPPPADAGKVCVVVGLPEVVPPSPPRWAGTAPADDGLALRWVPNAEPSLAGYRLYRSYDLKDAADVRSMTPLFSAATPEGADGLSAVRVRHVGDETPVTQVEVLPAGDTSAGRLVQFIDATVEGGRAVYYRLIAEDTFANRSLPSDLLAVRYPKRQPPDPPVWLSPVVSDGEVALAWTADEADLESLVMRRSQEEPLWRPVGPWIPRGEYGFVDADLEAGLSYEYRVRVRDRVGQVVDGPVLTVTL